MEELNHVKSFLSEKMVDIVLQMVGALLLLLLGWLIINAITKTVTSKLRKKAENQSLVSFAGTATNVVLKVLLVVAVIGMLGVETTSLIAALGSVGLAVGLALQGSLANVAGGVLLVVLKAFKEGDLIQAQGEIGVVDDIGLFNTILVSPQNRKVIIPNAALSNGVITNYSERGVVRCDVNVGISYSANIGEAKKVLLEMLNQHAGVLSDPAPEVLVAELGDSSVNLIVRSFVNVEDYWNVFFGTTERSKLVLDANNIEIPFPQRVMHLKSGLEGILKK